MLTGLSLQISCRLRGSLASKEVALWRFGILRLKCDEAKELSIVHGSFYIA